MITGIKTNFISQKQYSFSEVTKIPTDIYVLSHWNIFHAFSSDKEELKKTEYRGEIKHLSALIPNLNIDLKLTVAEFKELIQPLFDDTCLITTDICITPMSEKTINVFLTHKLVKKGMRNENENN